MENYIQLLIICHAILGGIALLSGFFALISMKGGKVHRASGKTFVYSMLLSGVSALVVSVLPDHENPFLFSIGVFSLYFVITGYRALSFRSKEVSLIGDKIFSMLMLVTGVLMILLPIVLSGVINIVLTVLATVGIVFAIRDFLLFKQKESLVKNRIKLHIGKIIGAYISATTAFIVVNQILPGIYGWLAPGAVGAIVITYFLRLESNKA